MNKYNLVFSYSAADQIGFESDYAFALSFIMSHHSFMSALGTWRRKTCLVTDEGGKNLIVNKFGLYFDEVTVLDSPYSMKISAMKKYAMNAFIHVDWDTYLLKTFPIRTLSSQLFCDYLVRNNPIDIKAVNQCRHHLYEPDALVQSVIDKTNSLWSIENGVVGQDGFGRWWEYTQYVEQLIEKHKALIELSDNKPYFKRFLENVLPYYYFRERGVEFDVVIDRNKETEFEYFHHQVANFNFIRLFGESKRNPFLVEAIEKFVRKYYPESHIKIADLKP